MNCDRYRQFIDAFASGELDAVNDPDALQHLNTCERCAAEASGIRQLKQSLNRVFADEGAPVALRERVRNAIRSDREAAPVTIPIQRRYRWVVPLGMAAAVAFVSLIYPIVFDQPRNSGGGGSGLVDARWASAVVSRHDGCVAMGRAHHRATLSQDVRQIRAALSKELRLDVLAPDLADAGFRLHSADACGIGRIPGAHIVYERISDGLLFSLFSVQRAGRLAPDSDGGSPRVHSISQTAGGLGVIAWHKAATTYLLCGKSGSNELETLAQTIG